MPQKNYDDATENTLKNDVKDDKGENENLPSNPDKITMDALTENESFPEVKENAIQAVQAQKEAEKIEAQKLEAENVRLKKDGTPAKKRGPKPKDAKTNFVMPQGVTPPPVSPSLEAGILTSALLEQMSVSLISDDFILSEQERHSNIDAWTKCYDYYGGVEVKPPVALMMNHMAIILVRAQKEKTQTKIALAKAWLKNKIANWKKGGKNAQSDIRPDNERKDDIRKEESKKS